MINHRQITEQQGKEIAEKYKLDYFECSAKDETGVFEAFDYMAHKIICLEQVKDGTYKDTNSFLLKKKKRLNKKKNKC